MRTKKFFYNSLGAFILQIVNFVVGMVLPHTMLQHYGSVINGLIASLTQFVSYFSLIETGVANSVIFYLYDPLSKTDQKRISSIVVATRKYYWKIGYIFLGLLSLLSLIYPFVVKSPLSYVETVCLIFIIGMNYVIDFFIIAKYRVLLTADQKSYVISITLAISSSLNCFIIYICSNLGISVVLARFFAFIAIVIRFFCLYWYVKKEYSYLNYKEEPDFKALNKRKDAFFLQLLGVIQHGAPIVIATTFTTLNEVSVYSIYIVIISGIRSILSIFENGLPAAFGEIISKKEKNTLISATRNFQTAYYMLIAVIYSTAMSVIIPFVLLYTAGIDDADYVNPILAILFVLDGFFYNMKTPQGMLVISAGLYKETKIQSTIQASIIVIAGSIGGYFWGLEGIVLGSLLSNIYRCIDLLFFIPKKVTQDSVNITFRKQLLSISIIIFSIFIMRKIMLIININSFSIWCCVSFAAIIFYSIMCLFVFCIFDFIAVKTLWYRFFKG